MNRHPPRPPKAVLFDFDLTLADSTRSIVRCFAHGCRAVGHPVPSPEVVRGLIGVPLAGMWRRIAHSTAVADAHEEAFVRAYRERAARHMTEETELFEGVPGVLERITDAGIACGVVSSKIRQPIEDVLVRRGVRERFRLVLGGDDVARPKPDPDGVLIALERLEVEAADAVYVGDSTIDAETARSAGVGFIAVTSGATPVKTFHDYPCRAILETMAALPERLGLAPVTSWP